MQLGFFSAFRLESPLDESAVEHGLKITETRLTSNQWPWLQATFKGALELVPIGFDPNRSLCLIGYKLDTLLTGRPDAIGK